MAPLYQSLRALIGSITLILPIVSGASLQQVTGFGTNPTNVGMYIYVPDQLAPNPPILVNPHACHGSAQAAFTGSQYATLASKYGFIVIYPDSPNTVDKCWDVSSSQTLSHNGGGDSLGIVSMVKWTLTKYNGNPNRVFVTGTSSGAMMTNVLCGAYPDVFAAGSAFAGVAFGCFAGNGYDVWNGDCATGLLIKTGAQWEAIVLAAYPGYTGYRPKMQVFHGTADTTLYPQNLQEEIKEWTAVLGLPSSPVQTIQNSPLSGWTEYIYGSTFQAYSAAGVTHDIQTQESVVMAWFDLTCTSNSCFSRTGGSSPPPLPSSTSISITPSTVASSKTTSSSVSSLSTSSKRTTLSTATIKPTTSNPVSTSTSPASSGTAAKWGQCGGIGYNGPIVCGPGAGTCHYSNSYYSQCY